MASRVVDGRQQIRAAITFHEFGRLVMWPYGYTMTNVPSDMTTQDHAAFVRIGRQMAATNGYTPQQASDLYISSGTSRDYQYGDYRIFTFTFELSVVDYPDDSHIASETGRNKEAVLYLMERAWCPLAVGQRRGPEGPLRRLRRRPRNLPRLDRDPDGTDTAPSAPASRAPTRPRRRATARSSSARHAPACGLRHRCPRRSIGGRQRPRRPHVRPLAADRPGGDRSGSG